MASQQKARVSYKVTVRPRSAVKVLPKITKTQMKKRFNANIWGCTCEDFADIQPNICKHIAYIVLSELRE